MLLVLCESSDISALWAADALRARGLLPTVLTGSELARARGWRHTIDQAGADFELQLESGITLRRGDIRGVLNRLSFLPGAWMQGIAGPDRDYALQEMLAFYLSWLHSLPPPMLNPPTPQGLCGNMRHPSAWLALGRGAGLPIRTLKQSCQDDPRMFWQDPQGVDDATVLVVGETVFGPDDLVDRHGAACVRLARDSACPVLGIRFQPAEDGDWRMSGAHLLPDLRQGGGTLADVLARELTQ